ncbi:MAG: citrate transporter [Lachnospiraceae bacterium]|nr:citrate transporter [Lachnospiraceae bacterium]
MFSIKEFIKKEFVLFAAFVLAVASCFFVHPDFTYISYIDFRTLGILLSLMIIMAGLGNLLVFRRIGEFLVFKMNSTRSLALIFIGLCFFSSMFITNDVALITFVPFTVVTLTVSNRKDLFIPVIVLETIAANLGSMLTPLGNPQNLYLYSLSEMPFFDFILLMLPYSICSAALLFFMTFLYVKNAPVKLNEKTKFKTTRSDTLKIFMYIVLFAISILVIVRIVPFQAGLVIVLASVFLFDKKVLKCPDYSLLFTFIFLFIFIGNIKRIPLLSEILNELVKLNEVVVSAVLSQFISNVPAAILCSGFTSDIPALIVGTNLGGLGTLIASMASLISFKQYISTDNSDVKKYMSVFTFLNILFLMVLLILYFLSLHF